MVLMNSELESLKLLLSLVELRLKSELGCNVFHEYCDYVTAFKNQDISLVVLTNKIGKQPQVIMDSEEEYYLCTIGVEIDTNDNILNDKNMVFSDWDLEKVLSQILDTEVTSLGAKIIDNKKYRTFKFLSRTR